MWILMLNDYYWRLSEDFLIYKTSDSCPTPLRDHLDCVHTSPGYAYDCSLLIMVIAVLEVLGITQLANQRACYTDSSNQNAWYILHKILLLEDDFGPLNKIIIIIVFIINERIKYIKTLGNLHNIQYDPGG